MAVMKNDVGILMVSAFEQHSQEGTFLSTVIKSNFFYCDQLPQIYVRLTYTTTN